ncbi:MAG: OmpH family outer membrane protein, partial [Saprospiraceae bacterium]
LFMASVTMEAQRFCYVDVEKILESVEDYKTAQSKLDQFASKWNREVAQKYKEIEQLYNKYQADKVLLSDNAQKQREDEIIQKEQEARDFQKAKFGPEGELFKKRQELVKPIQDKVYAAIEAYAQKRGFDFIFDRSSDASMLYANPELDKTQDLIDNIKK